MNNRTKATALTGWKYLFWSVAGAAIAAAIETLPGVHVPTPWNVVLPIVLAALGKMVATYLTSSE